MEKIISNLRTKAWRTAGARYNAARRLKFKESFSNFILATLSALSIIISVTQKILSQSISDNQDNYLTILTTSLSIFILAVSLLDWGGSFGARAESLFRNAEKLTRYHIELEYTLVRIKNREDISKEV